MLTAISTCCNYPFSVYVYLYSSRRHVIPHVLQSLKLLISEGYRMEAMLSARSGRHEWGLMCWGVINTFYYSGKRGLDGPTSDNRGPLILLTDWPVVTQSHHTKKLKKTHRFFSWQILNFLSCILENVFDHANKPFNINKTYLLSSH